MERVKKPRVGVALLAYNQGKYIDDAIKSLRKQTFQDFEVILADDGSDDKYTPKKIESVEYEKIKLKIVDGKNLGNAKRRKKLYELLDNEYVMDFSADDVLAPDFLMETVSYLDKYKTFGAVSTNIVYFNDNVIDGYAIEKYDKKRMNLSSLLSNNHVLGSSLMRNSVLKQLDLSGGFKRYQDWDRWITMVEAGWKIGLIEKPLFYYRQNKSSLSHSATIEQELEIRKLLLKKHDKQYKKHYEDIILGLDKRRLEVERSKGELELEYHKSLEEIKKLTAQAEELSATIREYQGIIKTMEEKNKNFWTRIRNKT